MATVGARGCGRSRAWRRAQWREHVEAQAASGVSAAAYCRRHGLHARSFYRWRRIFAAGAQQGVDAQASIGPREPECGSPDPVFAEVRLGAPTVSAWTACGPGDLEVVVRGERRVRVGPGFDEATLRRVVTALESLPC